MRNPFRYFNSSPEVFRITVMLYICYPLSLQSRFLCRRSRKNVLRKTFGL